MADLVRYHKLLRTASKFTGDHWCLFTTPQSIGFVLCSSNAMLTDLTGALQDGMVQWLDLQPDELLIRMTASPDQAIVISYEGPLSDLVHRFGKPVFVQAISSQPPSKEELKTLPLPTEIETALDGVLKRKRRTIELSPSGSFKLK